MKLGKERTNTSEPIAVADSELVPMPLSVAIDTAAIAANPLLQNLEQQVSVAHRETAVERSRWLPDIVLGFDNQTFGGSSKRYSSFSVGLAVPLFPNGTRSRAKASRINEQSARTAADYARTQLIGRLQQCLQECGKLRGTVDYYRTQAMPQADLIVRNSDESFRSGEISYTQHVMNLTLAADITTSRLESVYQYNLAVIETEQLLGINK